MLSLDILAQIIQYIVISSVSFCSINHMEFIKLSIIIETHPYPTLIQIITIIVNTLTTATLFGPILLLDSNSFRWLYLFNYSDPLKCIFGWPHILAKRLTSISSHLSFLLFHIFILLLPIIHRLYTDLIH